MSAEVVEQIVESVEAALPGARVEVRAASPGHFEVRVVSTLFEGESRVAQHQRVYAAITHLMKGDGAPVHAIDRLECVLP